MPVIEWLVSTAAASLAFIGISFSRCPGCCRILLPWLQETFWCAEGTPGVIMAGGAV